MEMELAYEKAFDTMREKVRYRRQKGIFTALGYTSNLDVLCDFKVDVLNCLLEQYLKDENLEEMKAPLLITSMEEFLHAIVYYCVNGIGGEVDIEDFEIIKSTFDTKLGMGGTATQGAMALAAVKCPSMVHLTDDSREVCEILKSPQIFTVSDSEKLIHTDGVKAKAEQEIHYIIQFKKGDVIELGGQKIAIPVSNRLIVTNITVNETVPFSKSYFHYIEKNAKHVTSVVLSSFNAIQQKKVLNERLDYVKKHCIKYKQNNEKGIVYFEDAHYHNAEVRKICLDTIYPHVDIVSMNEEELANTLELYDHPICIDDILSCEEGVRFLIQRFQIQKGVIVHTKDYSMYAGKKLEYDIESGLMYGNMMATAKAMNGWYGTEEAIAQVMELPLSEKGVENRKMISEKGIENMIVVPSKYMDKPKYTIGLGDSFVAGVQICFT